MLCDKPHSVFVNALIVVAVFGSAQKLRVQGSMPLKISLQGIAQGCQIHCFSLENGTFDGGQRVCHCGNPHDSRPVNGGVHCASVVYIQALFDAVTAKTGEKGL